MNEYIPLTVLLLLALYVGYGRLRGHIQALEELVSALQLAQQKLRDANRELQAELRRVESRLDSPGDKPLPTFQPEPEAEPPPVPREVPEKLVIPPRRRTEDLVRINRRDHSEVRHNESSSIPQSAEPPELPDLPEEVAPSLLSRIPWRDILARMHLLPPGRSESGETSESQLAAWWVTRIGLVLLIIAAVFFGIHVSQKTPPWLRVLTLSFVSLGTIGLGSRMKDRLEGFGRAIIGGGFALLYFTAFAAFALPATKVIDSPSLGVLAQLFALVAAITWSLWKRDQMVATLMLFLGFVSCGFSYFHDLDRFSALGILLLAVTGAFLFATRGWLTSFITALVGSWLSFGIYALFDQWGGGSPPFLQFLGSLVVLSVIFYAGSLACAARGLDASNEQLRRWLILGNTSAAAVFGYGITRLAYPEQLSTFYFALAGLYFAFTAYHYLRTTDRAVTESLFLKSGAMLCLGIATTFTGPVRWLAIAFQAFALLWTARRSGSRWIAAGFVCVLAVSIGWFASDLVMAPAPEWRWMEPARIAGCFYLVFLTALLALHGQWFPRGIGGSDEKHEVQAQGFRFAGALVIGFLALGLAATPLHPAQSDTAWFLFLLTLMVGALCPLMRSAIPCIAAVAPLSASYFAYALLPPSASQCTTALLLGATLVISAFCIAEAIRRYWPEKLSHGPIVLEIAFLLGLATLLPFANALCGILSLSAHAGIGVFLLFPLVAGAALLGRQKSMEGRNRARLSIVFQIIIGSLIVAGSVVTCKSSEFFPSALALAGLAILGLAARIRLSNVGIAGLIPVLCGFFSLWQSLKRVQPDEFVHDAINLAVLLLISTSLAWMAWKKLPRARLPRFTTWCDAVLHALGVFSFHLFFQKHLGEGADFLAASLLGLVIFAVSRRFPFRVFGLVSWLAVALACASSIIARNWSELDRGTIGFISAGFLVLVHLVSYHLSGRKDVRDTQALPSHLGFPEAISCIAVLAWTLTTLAAVKSPWEPAALAGVALLSSALWRWQAIPCIGQFGLGTLVLALFHAGLILVGGPFSSHSDSSILISTLLTSAGIAANGMILASAVRRVVGQKITAKSVLPWLHGVGALLIALIAFSIAHLVSDTLTAVFWGLSAIILFVCGIFSGLRAYRLSGLIGLVFCTAHIFIWDIQDTFYRIIAFFVIGLVMLVIGFLYQRFRERISAMDS